MLRASEVLDFVLSECKKRSPGSARYVTTGLRSFLRFGHLEGRTATPLGDAVPKIASRAYSIERSGCPSSDTVGPPQLHFTPVGWIPVLI